jgi:hypothetical protein
MSNGSTYATERLALADQAVIVAQAGLWLAQVEAACLSSSCDPTYCRVRDSLSRSLDSERAELALLQSQVVVVDRAPVDDHPSAYQGAAA